jgi:hypothetical protein
MFIVNLIILTLCFDELALLLSRPLWGARIETLLIL